jgi:LysR family hydrogen peroxide-inducible transcriptional activator
MISLRQLRYFDSLSRQLHFGHAADECTISQPALSQQIRELEIYLGTELVERGKTAIALTDKGREIARRGRDILAAVNDLTAYAHHTAKILTGPLSLGVIPTIGPYLLPAILPALKSAYPELRLAVRESPTANLLALLGDGRIDLALLALPAGARGLAELPLFEDAFHVVVPPDHPLASHQRIAIRALKHEKLLLLEEGHCLRDQALSLCKAGAAGEFGATSLSTIVELVSNGYGITIVPDMALAVETRGERRLRAIPFADPAPSRTIGLAWREKSPRKADFLEIAKLLREAHR